MLGTREADALAAWCRAIRHGHGAGLPLVRVFDSLARSGPPALRETAARINHQLEGGDSLDTALSAEGEQLPELFISLAAVGEQSGRLPEVFASLEEYYRLQARTRKEFWARATWPLVQFVAAVLVIALAIFLIGFLTAEAGPPPIGLGLTGASGALCFLGLVGAAVGGLVLAYRAVTRTAAKRAGFEAWLLRLPVVGPCVQAAAMNRFCLALGLTLDSSMPVSKAIRLSLAATGNSAFQADTDRIIQQLRKGVGLARAIGRGRHFSTEFLAVLSVGEVSGQVPETMARQAAHYQEETARRTTALTRCLAWGVYGLVGLFIIVAIIRMAGVYLQAIGA